MGVLAPLYLAGLAALAVPLVLHLIRRTPRGQQVFSSLMFLAPSPPRLTRRSKLDQILLLLLRLAALALLALAFARPFFREAATLALEDLPRRRVALLVDTSASMRRGDLWQQAVRQVEKELRDLGPHDEAALFAFADRLETVVDFPSSAAAAEMGATPASHRQIVRQQLRSLAPGWGATDLGGALAAVASELDSTSDAQQSAAEAQVIVISDFQKGARLEALQALEWPSRVRVIPRMLAPATATNAYAHLLASEEDAPDAPLRVRVANASNSAGDQFFVRWETGRPAAAQPASARQPAAASQWGGQVAVYVPPGQSRVVKLPRPEGQLEADRVVLSGDDHEFDNTFYVVPPRTENARVWYVGRDQADDQRGPQYYLRLALSDDPLRKVEIETAAATTLPPDAPEKLPQLLVATSALEGSLVEIARAVLAHGGTVLLVPADAQALATVTALCGDIEAAAVSPASGEFLLLGEIDFSHPLFVPFANPRYSDFTKIHFWKHRRLALKEPATTRVIARFDNGLPALLERTFAAAAGAEASGSRTLGRVYVLASGWQPDESQLALSSKFVPLIGALVDQACGTGQTLAPATIGQAVALPPVSRGGVRRIEKPSGAQANVPAAAESFDQTDEPGIYRVAGGEHEVRFAVNLAAAESDTAPLQLEQLEQLGVRMTAAVSRQERLARIRQQRDTELESRQKVWRWLIVGALGLVIFETFWAGRAARQIVHVKERGA